MSVKKSISYNSALVVDKIIDNINVDNIGSFIGLTCNSSEIDQLIIKTSKVTSILNMPVNDQKRKTMIYNIIKKKMGDISVAKTILKSINNPTARDATMYYIMALYIKSERFSYINMLSNNIDWNKLFIHLMSQVTNEETEIVIQFIEECNNHIRLNNNIYLQKWALIYSCINNNHELVEYFSTKFNFTINHIKNIWSSININENDDIINWTVYKYKNIINQNKSIVYDYIIELINQQNITTAMYIFNNVQLHKSQIKNISKLIIYMDNVNAVSLFNSHIKYLNVNNMIRLSCMYNAYNVFDYIISNYEFDTSIIDSVFKMCCKTNNINSIKMICNIFPSKYSFNGVPIINDILINSVMMDDIFINKYSITVTSGVSGECCCCLRSTFDQENKLISKLMQFGCHSSHTICIQCVKMLLKTSDKCPCCRTKIILKKACV